MLVGSSSTRAFVRATFGFSDYVRYSASDRLGSSDLMMSCGLRRCPPDHLLITYGDTMVFFFGVTSVTPHDGNSGGFPVRLSPLGGLAGHTC